MKLVHMHEDGAVDAVSNLTADPDLVEDGHPARAGLLARWSARQDLECSGCGVRAQKLNRAQRRAMWPRQKAPFDTFVRHEGRCPAMGIRVRNWLFQNRRLAS